MKKIFSVLFLFPAICFAQRVYWERTDNVYGKDESTIANYAKTFIQKNQSYFNQSGSDSTSINVGTPLEVNGELLSHVVFSMKKTNKFCFENLMLEGDVAFLSKQGKTKIQFRDIKYTILSDKGTSKCSGSGEYGDLTKSDCCKTYSNIDTHLEEWFSELASRYKKYLIKMRNDDTW